MTYQSAGVNIDAGNQVVHNIKKQVSKTFSAHVLSDIGGFGGAFDIKAALEPYTHPILVQSIDGVGTKLTVAKMMNDFSTIGHDIVANCCGDIVVMGARPLTFLDYVAHATLDVDVMESIMNGMIDACMEAGVSLIGGEPAEMPGTYQKDEHDVVGCVTGVVEKDEVITGESIQAGDVILGIASNGIHTNGLSLARKVLFDVAGYSVFERPKELALSVGEELLRPHANYTQQILSYLDAGIKIKGMAHITGGGMIENIPRILPTGLRAMIQNDSWHVPPIFTLIQEKGHIDAREMYRTFNMGIGLVIVCDDTATVRILSMQNKMPVSKIGKIVL